MACGVRAQAFNPDANNDGQIGAGDVIAVLAVYGLPFESPTGPTILHFDPDTIGNLPLGYDLYVAQDFTFPYVYVTVPDGEYPGQSFRLARDQITFDVFPRGICEVAPAINQPFAEPLQIAGIA